jgi:hypothetical protein
MKVYRINNRNYYSYQDVCDSNPLLTERCDTHTDFIEQYNLPKIAWVYARLTKGVLVKSDGSKPKVDKFFIRKSYYLENMENNIIPEPYSIENDDDMFKGPDYELSCIQLVGDGTVNGTYFRAKNVLDVFEIPSLMDDITDNNIYQKNIHYKIFFKDDKKGDQTTSTYLTYKGLIKALLATNSSKLEEYATWASETLFVVQMGTMEQKLELASKLTEISTATLREAAKTYVRTMPCIYLLSIGTVQNLRKAMELGDDFDDTDQVYKFGYTSNVDNKVRTYKIKYGDLEGSEIKLVHHFFIDIRKIGDAKSYLSSLHDCICSEIKYPELVIASEERLKFLNKECKKLEELYRGSVSELSSSVKIAKYNYEIKTSQNDLVVLKIEKAMADKDLEIARLKYLLARAGIEA